jgi:enoyl-[acyl-carrier protein] reductase I
MLAQCKAVSPTRSLVSIDEVGNTAAFLLSDNSLGITAETIYIDGGFNALACCVDQTASENA